MPERHRRKIIALEHKGRAPGVGVCGVPDPRLMQRLEVGKLDVFAELVGPLGQLGVGAKHLTRGFGLVVIEGFARVARNVTVRPVLGHLAGVDLMGQVAVHQILRPDRAADRGVLRVHAGDAGDQPVRLAQIEARVHTQHHHRCRGLRRADTGDQHQHAVFRVEVKVVVGRKVEDRVEVTPLLPELKFARLIARVGADFEHGYDDNFHGNRRGRRGGGGCFPAAGGQRQRRAEEQQKPFKRMHTLSLWGRCAVQRGVRATRRARNAGR